MAFLRASKDISDPVRRLLYEELTQRDAGKTQAGFEVFVEGLQHPNVHGLSLLGLADAPPRSTRQPVAMLLENIEGAGPTTNLDGVVNRLSKWGADAKLALPVITHIFRDPRQDDRTRSIAAQAMLTIGPVANAMKEFGPEHRGIVLGPLFFVGGTTRGRFDGEPTTKNRVRQYVRAAVRARRPQG